MAALSTSGQPLKRAGWIFLGLLAVFSFQTDASAQGIDKQKARESQTWWDNRDWDWFKDAPTALQSLALCFVALGQSRRRQ